MLTWIVLALLSLLLVYGCFLVMRPFFGEVFLAVVLAIVFYPMHAWICRKTHRPNLSAWLSTLATGLLFLMPIGVLGVVLSRESTHAIDALSSAIGPTGSFDFLDRGIAFLGEHFGLDATQTQDFLKSKLDGLSDSLLSNAVRSLQGLGSWLFSSVITLVTMFFLFRGGAALLGESKHWVPLPPHMMDLLFHETRVQIFANVYSVVAVALAQGLLTGVGFWMTGLPSPVFWATVASLFSILPIVGAGIVWFPAVLYLALIGDMGKASLLLGWGVLIVSMADNVLRPIVLSERAQMNTAVMFFALLGGIEAFGLVGLFAGPIVFSLAIAVIKLLRTHSSAIGINSAEERLVT